jgi:hypothetical protein
VPSLGFGGKTVGLGPIFRAGSAANRPTPGGLLLVAAADGAVGFTAAGTAAGTAVGTAVDTSSVALDCVTAVVALEVDNTGAANAGEEERWTGTFSGAGTLD